MHMVRRTYLVEFSIIAALELVINPLVDFIACLVPEPGKCASLVVFLSNLEVLVAAVRLPYHVVLGGFEGCRGVQVALEAQEITERRYRVIHDDIHSSVVNGLYSVPPFRDCAEMLVEVGEIYRLTEIGQP